MGAIIIHAALIVVPFVDRGRYLSPRRRLVFVVVGAAVALVLLVLGFKAQFAPVEAHMLEGVM